VTQYPVLLGMLVQRHQILNQVRFNNLLSTDAIGYLLINEGGRLPDSLEIKSRRFQSSNTSDSRNEPPSAKHHDHTEIVNPTTSWLFDD
jgi:hypothetical protein